MRLEEAVSAVECCKNTDQLMTSLQRIAEDFGFVSFAFLDVGFPGMDDPFTVSTVSDAWDVEYRSNGFVHVDPILPIVRRTNIPFSWDEIKMPKRTGRRKSGALRTMEAAQDHGFKNGLVIPFHFSDRLGRINSTSSVFFWKDKSERFETALRNKKHELHIILLYWAQRMVELNEKAKTQSARHLDTPGVALDASLSDRERDVLSWSARGKTMVETAAILGVSVDTVKTHIRSCLRKLGASNSTHAACKALYLGLIDV